MTEGQGTALEPVAQSKKMLDNVDSSMQPCGRHHMLGGQGHRDSHLSSLPFPLEFMGTAAFLEPGIPGPKFTLPPSFHSIEQKFWSQVPNCYIVRVSHMAKPRGREGRGGGGGGGLSTTPTLQGCWEGRFVHLFIQYVFFQHLPGTVLGAGYVAVNKRDTSPCPPKLTC